TQAVAFSGRPSGEPHCTSTAKEPLPMARRWLLPVATLGLTLGSFMMAGAASASTAAHHPTIHSTTVRAYKPGGVMIRPGGVARVIGHGGRNATATSTNWSGYAVTGANGAFHSVSASWTQPTATCTTRRAQYA